jgi:hypothetical protein
MALVWKPKRVAVFCNERNFSANEDVSTETRNSSLFHMLNHSFLPKNWGSFYGNFFVILDTKAEFFCYKEYT